MGHDHAAVGRALLSHWNLPTGLQEPVAHHHKPMGASRFQVEAAVVHMADIMAHAMLMGNSGERFVPPLKPEAWERLGIAEQALGPVTDDVDHHYATVIQTILEDSE
jgi:HD-like signal output (HDOD) protein